MNITVDLNNDDLHTAIKDYLESVMKVPRLSDISIIGIKTHELNGSPDSFSASVSVVLEGSQ